MEKIKNSKINYDFLFVDSSISEKNLIDFISTNKNCRVISFDFESTDILKKHYINFVQFFKTSTPLITGNSSFNRYNIFIQSFLIYTII